MKADEEWGELSACEAGDSCGSSHTRTEQQFHPEVLSTNYVNCIDSYSVALIAVVIIQWTNECTGVCNAF